MNCFLNKYIDKNHMDEPTYQLLKSQFFQLYTQRLEMFSDNLKRVNFFTELPKPDEIYDYHKYIDPSYLVMGSTIPDDTKENIDHSNSSNLNFVL